MLMNVYEYNVSVKGECVAGFNDLDDAKAFARHTANEQRDLCDVIVINAFTGEVHLILSVAVTITYNSDLKEVRRTYEVKESWEV